MSAFKITLTYDGTDFVGWQRQAVGVSIQGLVEDALGELACGPVAVAGAGRTDAGVHAIGQVASFSIDRTIGADTVMRALNARLPGAIRVIAAEEAPAGFHARFGARAKTYRYRVWNAPIVPPFERLYAWHIIDSLDLDRMATAARRLEGTFDFSAFRAVGGSTKTTTRSISVSRVAPRVESIVAYEISGSGFLRHMVRNIVGTLVEIGRHRREVEWISEVLASRDRARAGPTAPAEGLFLLSVEYGDL